MNDRHLPGVPPPATPAADFSYGPYGSPYEQPLYGVDGQQDTSYGYVTGTFDTLGAAYGDSDPLFGPLPDGTPTPHGAAVSAPGTEQWDTGQQPVYGDYDTAAWSQAPAQPPGPPEFPGETAYGYVETGYDTTGHGGQWDTGQQPVYGYGVTSWDDTGGYATVEPPVEPGGHPEERSDHPDTREMPVVADTSDTFGTSGAYSSAGQEETGPSFQRPGEPERHEHLDFPGHPEQHDPYAPSEQHDPYAPSEQYDPSDQYGQREHHEDHDDFAQPERPAQHERSEAPVRPPGSRRRRSVRPKRSALLTVAVPSVCVMGVTAVAAASVSDVTDDGDETTTQAAADASAIKSSVANRKLDTQIAGVSTEAENFAGRASRTQERIDLKERQEAERKRKEAEAARKEAMRPKFALPVAQHGLSAYYGQAGINWVSLHTGIDFPVNYGTPVMAATDGTVTTRSHPAYGIMSIVTAADGTETWYCHLSSTRIRSGYVKAGDIIAYSGNSGKSTGPHLHFEVRPGGGAAIDPLPWFRSKGLDPT